jgi:hypothetical protein
MPRTESKMKNWQCPKCSQQIQAIGTAVSHRCKSNKNLNTMWELVKDSE